MNNRKLVQNEQGFVLIATLLVLMLLAILGVSTTTNSTLELQIAGNDIRTKLAFFAAESARSYVEASPALWSDTNLSAGHQVYFPENSDHTATEALGTTQSYNGFVSYSDQTPPPRGSGYEADKFASINYRMDLTGNGPANSNAISKVAAGFYRIGFKTAK